MFRTLDLFSGACGGWSLGLESVGFETVAACEIDPWRREQYGRNFPHARLYEDVSALTADQLCADGRWPDIIVGSPPCQDASTANVNGRGLDGERTGLFFEWLRLVGECRPRWALAENVPGIRRRGIDRILDGLASLDYTFWPIVVGAKDFGANHIRRRLVLVAHRNADSHVGQERQCEEIGSVFRRSAADTSGADAPHADRDTVRHQSGRCCRPDREGPAFPVRPVPHTNGEGQHDLACNGRKMARFAEPRHFSPGSRDVADAPCVGFDARGSWEARGRSGPKPDGSLDYDADARCARLAQRESERRDAREEREATQRGRLQDWSGNFAEYLDEFGQGHDGVSSKVARACISAYGDSFMPQIAQAIGRFIKYIDLDLGGMPPR